MKGDNNDRIVDGLAKTNRRGRPKKTITDQELQKVQLADEILNRLQFDNGLSKESIEELRNSIDKTLSNYTFEKENSEKSIMELNMDILEEFLSAKRIEGKSKVTEASYGNEASKMFMNVNKLYSEITTDDIREYMNYRKVHDGLANTSIANIRMYLRSFFSWMKIEGKIKVNPMERIAPIKTERKVVETLSDEELEIIRCACENERDLAIVDMLSGSGMRVSELCGLNQDDVDFDNGTIKVFGKGSKERVCFLTGRAKVHLKWYLAERTDDNPALFVTTKKPYSRITKNGVEYLLKEIAKRTGIPKLRLYPHVFRKTLGTALINKGSDISIVQKILGHSSPNITAQCYANISDSTLHNAHNKFVS